MQETDKATIDVEAQDDGIMGKIIVCFPTIILDIILNTTNQTPDGTKNIAVGKIIALLAEEGDDISNLEVPKEQEQTPAPAKEEPPPSPKPQTQSSSPPSPSPSHPSPTHTRPLFPSVHRLLLEYASSIPNPTDIKPTGIRGMLTKGDVLAFLGKASGPLGSYKGKEVKGEMKDHGVKAKAEEIKVCIFFFPFSFRSLGVVRFIDGIFAASGWTCAAQTHSFEPITIITQGTQSYRYPSFLPSTTFPDLLIQHFVGAVPTTQATFDSVIADYLPPPPTPAAASKPIPAPIVPRGKSAAEVYFDGLI
jgi:hypothetical protein